MAKIELPESWACVVEPLRALVAEIEREARSATPPNGAAVAAQWARVSESIRATARARITEAQAAQAQSSKR